MSNQLSKDCQISLRVYPRVREAIEEVAKVKGVSISQYLTPIVVNALHKDGANLSVFIDLARMAKNGERFGPSEPQLPEGDPIADLAKIARGDK